MIVEIEDPKPSCSLSLDYNEGKVLSGVAQIVGYANLPSPDYDDVYMEFARWEKNARYKTRQVSFHASVNPSADDGCTEEQVLDFIYGMMDHIGMGDQPMVVYRHSDIDRTHYHVVSVRIGRDGRKISNHYEKKAVTAYMRKVCTQYGFALARKGSRVVRKPSVRKKSSSRGMPHYEPEKPSAQQLRDLFTEALSYDFCGEQQLFCILADMGVKAFLSTSDKGPFIVMQGLNADGVPCTGLYSESTLGMPMMDMCMTASADNRRNHHLRAREKDRVKGLTGAAFTYARSQNHFDRILRNRGITPHYSYDVNGQLFGVTFVDHTTRSVFKASETGGAVSAPMIREALASGRWHEERGGKHRRVSVAEARFEAYREAVALRDRSLGIVARIVKPSHPPKGNSWNGKPKKSEAELELERDMNKAGGLRANLDDNHFHEYIE